VSILIESHCAADGPTHDMRATLRITITVSLSQPQALNKASLKRRLQRRRSQNPIPYLYYVHGACPGALIFLEVAQSTAAIK